MIEFSKQNGFLTFVRKSDIIIEPTSKGHC